MAKVKICSEIGCPVSETGECINGIDVETCSHVAVIDEAEFVFSGTDIDQIKNEESPHISKSEYVGIHSGKSLTAEFCSPILEESLGRLIILAGRAKSGKTTSLASLMQLFQQGENFAGYMFSGSDTLVGFEMRAHKSRTASGLDKPTTDRTIPGPREYLHLKVHKNGQSNLIFTDISGEDFKKLSDSEEECRSFTLLKRADHFVLFFDAFSLSDLAERHRTKVEGIAILRSLIETDMLSPNTNIQIIFSRWDLLAGKENRDETLQFIEGIKTEIGTRFGTTHPKINFFEVAARPDDDTEFGFGLSLLLPIWVEQSPFINERDFNGEPKVSIPIPINSRQFSKFEHLNRKSVDSK